jgi:hypothetical protein
MGDEVDGESRAVEGRKEREVSFALYFSVLSELPRLAGHVQYEYGARITIHNLALLHSITICSVCGVRSPPPCWLSLLALLAGPPLLTLLAGP